jgi:hypothetical protein
MLVLSSCAPKSEITTNTLAFISTQIDEDAIKTWDLKGEAYDAWKKIEQDWTQVVFSQILKKHKIKLNCSDCPRVNFKVKLKIDSNGKLVSYQKLKLNVCGGKSPKGFEQELIQYFTEITFDKSLNGMVIEVYLGRTLKC